jgi:ATP-dependent helicase STH1/SNF2
MLRYRSLLNFLLPTIFNSADTFNDWFNKPFEAQGGVDNQDMDEEEKLLVINRLHEVLRPFVLRRMKSEVQNQLPEKVERVLKCELSAWQSKVYNQIQSKAVRTLDPKTGNVKKTRLRNTIMQLRKICNHPYLFHDEGNFDWSKHTIGPVRISSVHFVSFVHMSYLFFFNRFVSVKCVQEIIRCSGKLELLDRMLPKLQATGHRVLMFFQMTRMMDIFEEYLLWREIKWLRYDTCSCY